MKKCKKENTHWHRGLFVSWPTLQSQHWCPLSAKAQEKGWTEAHHKTRSSQNWLHWCSFWSDKSELPQWSAWVVLLWIPKKRMLFKIIEKWKEKLPFDPTPLFQAHREHPWWRVWRGRAESTLEGWWHHLEQHCSWAACSCGGWPATASQSQCWLAQELFQPPKWWRFLGKHLPCIFRRGGSRASADFLVSKKEILNWRLVKKGKNVKKRNEKEKRLLLQRILPVFAFCQCDKCLLTLQLVLDFLAPVCELVELKFPVEELLQDKNSVLISHSCQPFEVT